MTIQIRLEEAQANLPELIKRLRTEHEVVITQADRPIARLVSPLEIPRQPRKPGSAKGKLQILEDDEEHLKDFGDYMR